MVKDVVRLQVRPTARALGALAACVLAASLSGCSDGGGTGPAPSTRPLLRHHVILDDRSLGRAALAILQAPLPDGSARCGQCHGLTRQTLRHWRALSDEALSSCLTDLSVASATSAQSMLRCLRGGSDAGAFSPARLGIYTTATDLPWFRYVFERALGADAEGAHGAFVARAAMPPPPSPGMTQAQFDVVAEWFVRGLPGLDDLVPEDPRPERCTPGVSSDVAEHVRQYAARNWGTLNRERGLLMYGCQGAARPEGCLAAVRRARDTDFGRTWDVLAGTTHRVLFTTDYPTAWWTRTSADGRFVAHGAHTEVLSGRFIDLQEGRVILADGGYDPAFFPDNSGFVFHSGGAVVCEHAALTLNRPTRLTFLEPQCRRLEAIGLYEHVGASLDGGDYWSADTQFESDDGGHEVTTRNPGANFTEGSRVRLVRMENSGAGFTQRAVQYVPIPYEGDSVLSPSGRLMVTRVSGAASEQLGFVLRRVDVTRAGSEVTVALPEVARYCLAGSKATFSYDERWLALHRYVTDEDATELGFSGPSDPGFAPYRALGAANVYLVDLTTGARHRITNVAPGQYAVFPHYRADGWIYFMVRTAGSSAEHVVASDAGLRLAAP